MKWFSLCLLVALVGCASVRVKRSIMDHDGNEIGTVDIDSRATTAFGVRTIMGQAREFEETQNRELERIGADSVARGKPTTVTTPRGSVTSGYTGYGNYGGTGNYYGGYNVPGYNPYSDPMAYAPGVAPEMLIAAELARRGGYLPPLAQPTVSLQPQGHLPAGRQGADNIDESSDAGRVGCPTDYNPTTVAERLACVEYKASQLLKMHKR